MTAGPAAAAVACGFIGRDHRTAHGRCESPTPARVGAVLDRCIEPVIAALADPEHGGFLVDLDERLRPAGPQRKSLEHAARTTLALALLHAARPTGGYEGLLRRGYAFLTDAMWDADHGGFYALVERDGTPAWDGLKHPHAVTYAARAFAHGADVLGAQVSADWTRRSLAWLDDVAWDGACGAYRGTFRRSNTAFLAGEVLPTEHGDDPLGAPLGLLEMNTTSDALGMHVDLVRAGLADPTRLGVLAERIAGAVQPPGVLPYLFLPDWTPTPSLARTGHQLQTVRRLIEAGDLVDDGGRGQACAFQLAAFALTAGRHPDGGFPVEMGPKGWEWSTAGSTADRREWWVQLEALDAAAVLARRATQADQRERFARERGDLWSGFVDRHVDWRHGGTFALPRSSRRRAGTGGASKANAWKDISHETAVLLDLQADR